MATAKGNKPKQFLDEARKLHRRKISSTEFWNSLCGIDGQLSRLFPTQTERVAFSKTAEWKKFHELWQELQEQDKQSNRAFAATTASANGTVILRLPKSVHSALIREAEHEGTSLNQLCVAKLSAQLAEVVS